MNNPGKLLFFSVILLLFLPSVAAVCRFGDSERPAVRRSAAREDIMRGEDEPGKMRIYLIPGDIVDINRASERELELLPCVGEAIAAGIVEYRERTGGFEDISQLMEIDGIGEKEFLEISPMVRAGDFE